MAMHITLNQEPKTLSEPQSVIDFLKSELQQEDFSGIAVAINANILPKSEWERTILKDGDAILLVRAAQGG